GTHPGVLITALAASGTEAAAEPWRDLSLVYRPSYSCTVWRATPYRRATSVTAAASSRTSSTARYRCSTTPSSTSTPGPLSASQPDGSHRNARDCREPGSSPEYRPPTRTTVAQLPQPRPQPVAQEPEPRCQASTGL